MKVLEIVLNCHDLSRKSQEQAFYHNATFRETFRVKSEDIFDKTDQIFNKKTVWQHSNCAILCETNRCKRLAHYIKFVYCQVIF